MDDIIIRSVVIGNTSKKIPVNELRKGDQSTHVWSVYIRPLHPNNELFNFISKVTFHLHPTFTPNKITLTTPPFEISQKGWGEFGIRMELQFGHKDIPPATLHHFLKLYPENDSGKTTPVVFERYEELIFNKPPPVFVETLRSGRAFRFHRVLTTCHCQKIIDKYGKKLDRNAERLETKKIDRWIGNVQKKINAMKLGQLPQTVTEPDGSFISQFINKGNQDVLIM